MRGLIDSSKDPDHQGANERVGEEEEEEEEGRQRGGVLGMF